MCREFVRGLPQVPLAERYDPVQAFLFHRPDKPVLRKAPAVESHCCTALLHFRIAITTMIHKLDRDYVRVRGGQHGAEYGSCS